MVSPYIFCCASIVIDKKKTKYLKNYQDEKELEYQNLEMGEYVLKEIPAAYRNKVVA